MTNLNFVLAAVYAICCIICAHGALKYPNDLFYNVMTVMFLVAIFAAIFMQKIYDYISSKSYGRREKKTKEVKLLMSGK
jgi:predicted membrane channel-forming protein YqfA (hemolysin III family)